MSTYFKAILDSARSRGLVSETANVNVSLKKIQMSASTTASSFYTKILLLCESVGRHLVTNCSDEVSYLF